MERRYLAATLALVATFAVFNHGFSSGHLSRLPRSRTEVLADLACVKQSVAQKLVAVLEPYTGREPEKAQLLAELNLPELARIDEKVADAQILVREQVARQRCEAAMRARKAVQPVYRMQILTNDRNQQLSNLAVIRAEELSARAQEWQAMVDSRQLEASAKALERAQEASARAMEHAQCAWERAQAKAARQHTPGMPIHINFVAPRPAVPVHVTVNVPAAPTAPEAPSSDYF
jgi:hypothetical protein